MDCDPGDRAADRGVWAAHTRAQRLWCGRRVEQPEPLSTRGCGRKQRRQRRHRWLRRFRCLRVLGQWKRGLFLPYVSSSFWGASTGGWSSQDAYPREVADAHGSYLAEIVGFASNGVYVSLANGLSGFNAPAFANGTSFWGAQTGGWSSQDTYTRELADVNNDQIADIVGFASKCPEATETGGFPRPRRSGAHFGAPKPAAGAARTNTRALWRTLTATAMRTLSASPRAVSTVSLNHFGAAFLTPTFVQGSSFWGAQTGGWSSQNRYPRELADVNGDGKPDIVGFAQSGVYVSINTSTAGNVSFAAPVLAANSSFWGASAGGWSSNDLYPRELANITNGDTKADIVGFASNGVWTSISTTSLPGGHPAAALWRR